MEKMRPIHLVHLPSQTPVFVGFSHARFPFNQKNPWFLAIRMGSKDSGHVGDFIIGQCSSCFLFLYDLQSGENFIQVKIKVNTTEMVPAVLHDVCKADESFL